MTDGGIGGRTLFRFEQERHRDVRLQRGIDLGAFARHNHLRPGLDEIAEAAADYPLAFLKDADTGQFRLVILLGLAPGTNVYLDGDFWQAVYLPQEVVAAPFCLAGPEKMLCVNEYSALISTTSGDPLFGQDGSEAAGLAHTRAMLLALDRGRAAADRMVAVLLELGLIRPLSLSIQFDSGPSEAVRGIYTISPPRLQAIKPADLVDLHSSDYLAPTFAIMQSLTQLNRVRQLHNLHSARKISALEMVMEHN